MPFWARCEDVLVLTVRVEGYEPEEPKRGIRNDIPLSLALFHAVRHKPEDT